MNIFYILIHCVEPAEQLSAAQRSINTGNIRHTALSAGSIRAERQVIAAGSPAQANSDGCSHQTEFPQRERLRITFGSPAFYASEAGEAPERLSIEPVLGPLATEMRHEKVNLLL